MVKIQEAKNDNKLVFFIGSGMSTNVGLPDWKQLINELKKGEKSEKVKDFDRNANLKNLHAKYLK